MVDLTSEELSALEELTDVYKSGRSVSEFIEHRLYDELSERGAVDGMGEYELIKHDGFDKWRSTYESLYDKGLLEGSKYRRVAGVTFGELSVEGRCYLSDKAKKEKEANSKKWSDRRFTIIASLITCAVSALLGYIAGHI